MTGTKTVHEGELEIVSETLELSESISWDLEVLDGYDIQFSVIVRSIAPSGKGSWIYLEPTRLSRSVGAISPSELAEDGIELPVELDFKLDNEYSWFSAKEIRLSIRRCSSTPTPVAQNESLSVVSQSPSRDDLERRRSLQSRERLDLLWMKHVIAEALDRCPEGYDELRVKLGEIRTMLRYIED